MRELDLLEAICRGVDPCDGTTLNTPRNPILDRARLTYLAKLRSAVRRANKHKTSQEATGAKSPVGPREVRPPRQSAAAAAVLQFVQQHGRITRQDYATLAAEADCKEETISFAVSSLFENQKLALRQVVDDDEQRRIAPFLEQAVSAAGGTTRLRPIKEALDALTQTAVDYVQLRIALAKQSSA